MNVRNRQLGLARRRALAGGAYAPVSDEHYVVSHDRTVEGPFHGDRRCAGEAIDPGVVDTVEVPVSSQVGIAFTH